ncbi:UDP-Glc:alpha-D-GlcNAc-diphosphoundecaprenol beta-1,3-glucosyltransferase WfgD [invertebrate metagenome]|uniref:UDP-Glc:alpha-D-GlcNAc-diphosphoundecaprenol beta-1,3-glucosyltransferase WfgD n=1 Tax=invertebrate metagenome TaxID=1711999 RepID=A0A2H9T3C4_9ZZZZ
MLSPHRETCFVSKYLFSVIIPAFNYGHTIARAVHSVLKQPINCYELLVINDGSSDHTENSIRQLHCHYSSKSQSGQFRSLHQSNHGLAFTRNTGIDHTSGHFLIFLDADDEMTENALLHLERIIQKKPRIDMIIGAHLSVSATLKKRFRPRKPVPYQPQQALREYLITAKLPIINGATAMARHIFNHYRYPVHFPSNEDIPVFAYALANFHCITTNTPIARIHKHTDSMRHNISSNLSVGMSLVDEVFSPARLPPACLALKAQYTGHRYQEIFRALYRAGYYCKALDYFAVAIKQNPMTLFQLSILRKAARALWRQKRKHSC